MPQIYNGSQSLLEYYAINGNPLYPDSGRNKIIKQTHIGESKYIFKGPYMNDPSGTAGTQYGLGHTNAMADTISPYNGKGTGDAIDTTNTHNGVTARYNYKGGNEYDIKGIPTQIDSGRNKQIILNATTWGYGPSAISGGVYVKPNMSLNVGQVII